MTMKKRFLGLALAAMVALPATTAYAATSQTITFDDTQTQTHNVSVTGNISKADGTAAVGKITVELPTTMTFGVDQNSTLTGCNFNVQNRSDVGIDLFVSDFRTNNGGITLKSKSDMATPESFDRSNVSLILNGNDGGSPTEVDLSTIKGNSDQKLLNVSKNSSGFINLTGTAGTNQDSSNVENGASGDFTLVFKVKKDTKS